MIALRVYLLSGLLLHKVIWTALRPERERRPGAPPRGLSLVLVKGAKVLILLFLLVQTMLPDLLPIARAAFGIRAAGVALYTLGLAMAIAGRLTLGDHWSDIEQAGIVEGQEIIDRGIYKHIRHPIYAGDLLLVIGLELALNSWLVLAGCLLVPVVCRQALQEERVLRAALPGYGEYAGRSKRFLPFLFVFPV